MEQKLAILVKFYKELLAYFPKTIKPTIIEYNEDCIKIVRGITTSIQNSHNNDEPYNLVFYEVYKGKILGAYIGAIAICEDEPDVGFFPDDNK